MSREEFLKELEISLRGRIDEVELSKQIAYYNSYISEEVNKGRSIDEVMNSLGSPRLIAKTIVQTYGFKDDPISKRYNEANRNTSGYDSYNQSDNRTNKTKNKIVEMVIVVSVLLTLLAIFGILGIVFAVFRFLAPVIMMLLVVYVILRIFIWWIDSDIWYILCVY